MKHVAEDNWCGLEWTPFVAFTGSRSDFQSIPTSGGLYRIRVAGTMTLAYIGQTGRNLRERINGLVRNTHKEQMPFNDPHTAAPRLWSFRIEDGLSFEASAATSILPKPERMSFESLLIWTYRRSAGHSPLCNFGRLHRNYLPSRNRSTELRGSRLPDGAVNMEDAPSLPALELTGSPTETDWMDLHWSRSAKLTAKELRLVPKVLGVYQRILDSEVIYYGGASNLSRRLKGQVGKRPNGLTVSFVELPYANAKCQRLEIENDLIGAHFDLTSKAPASQFRAD